MTLSAIQSDSKDNGKKSLTGETGKKIHIKQQKRVKTGKKAETKLEGRMDEAQ